MSTNQEGKNMIYSNVKTHYIDNGQGTRLVKYDVIKISNQKYVVKVFDDQQRSISPPHNIVEIDTLVFTHEDYMRDTGQGGFQTSVMDRMPNSFDGHVLEKCQEHRNSLND